MAAATSPAPAAGSGIAVHVSAGVEDPRATKECPANSAETMLHCWTGAGANLVIRSRPGKSGEPAAVEEVWILGPADKSDPAGPAPMAATEASPDGPEFFSEDPGAMPQDRSGAGDPRRLDEWLNAAAMADDPESRLRAVAQLGSADDPGGRVKAALESALGDADPAVRAQAVAVLERRFGDGAEFSLRQALADEQASVRLMAVDHAGSDRALLAQALGDPDLIVRTLAERKLRELDSPPSPR